LCCHVSSLSVLLIFFDFAAHVSGLVFPPTECANSYAWICSHGEVCQSKHDGILLCSSLLVHSVVNSVCSLRSQDANLLAKLSVYTSIGRRAFSFAARQIWNAVPRNIHNSPSVGSFKHSLKHSIVLLPFNFLNF